MNPAVAPREHNASKDDHSLSDRDRVLARYRQLREINVRHHRELLKFISDDALLKQARRLGLARGKTLILEDIDEMSYVYDLAIYTASAGRSRAVDRYARSAQLTTDSDERLVLEAMCAARFSILVIEGHHETAGLIATDLFRGAKTWLVDLGLESSMPDGGMIATRLLAAGRFSMTTGVNVPFDVGLFADIQAELPRRLGDGKLSDLIDDWRFAETIYRIALASGIMDRIAYQDLPDGA